MPCSNLQNIASGTRVITESRMNKNVIIASVILLGLLLTYCCTSQKKLTKDAKKLNDFSLSDSVKVIYGDSVSQILFGADIVQLMELDHPPIVEVQIDSVLKDSVNSDKYVSDSLLVKEIIRRDSLYHGYAVKKDFGVLTKEQIAPLYFLLSDRYAYMLGDDYPSAPFMGRIALNFERNEELLDMIFSFSGGQIQVITADSNYILKYNYEHLFMHYFQQFLKDETIQQLLDNNI